MYLLEARAHPHDVVAGLEERLDVLLHASPPPNDVNVAVLDELLDDARDAHARCRLGCLEPEPGAGLWDVAVIRAASRAQARRGKPTLRQQARNWGANAGVQVAEGGTSETKSLSALMMVQPLQRSKAISIV